MCYININWNSKKRVIVMESVFPTPMEWWYKNTLPQEGMGFYALLTLMQKIYTSQYDSLLKEQSAQGTSQKKILKKLKDDVE